MFCVSRLEETETAHVTYLLTFIAGQTMVENIC